MTHLLAQGIILPGQNGTPIPYPTQMQNFVFQGVNGTIGSVVSRAIPFVLGFAGIGLLLMILAAGFSMLTSAGDAKKLEGGKQQLTNAIVGFLIVFVAFWVVQIVGKIFGIQEFFDIFG